ncbi:MAG TPA: hypothetical protein VMI31_00330 [Fimbriimonadaceae bacterium]|nr:hypothetical protein [Fimbriimonadaceae bacterium]
MICVALLAGWICGFPQTSRPAGIEDAKHVFHEIAAANSVDSLVLREQAFVDALDAYNRQSPKMTPGSAAKRWLALVDRGQDLPRRGSPTGPRSYLGQEPGSIMTCADVLPRPEVWPEIEKLLASRPESRQKEILLLFFARLSGDDDRCLRICDSLQRIAKGDGREPWIRQVVSDTRAQIQSRMTPRAKLKAQTPDTTSIDYSALAKLPDAKVIPILRAELDKADYAFSIHFDHRLRELAQQAGLSGLDRIKRAPWGLVESMHDAPFLEKLVDHYGVAGLFSSGDEASTAKSVHIGVLLDRGDIDEAVRLFQVYRPEVYLFFSDFPNSHPAFAQKWFDGIVALQNRLPTLDLWAPYVAAAESSGHAKEAVARLKTLISEPSVEPALRDELSPSVLALDEFLHDEPALRADYFAALRVAKSSTDSNSLSVAGGALREFGDATGDREAVDRGIEAELKDASRAGRDTSLLDALAAEGRFQEAEEFLVRGLASQLQQGRGSVEGDDYGIQFARLYYLANRPAEVIRLLDRYPYWGFGDIGLIHRGYSEEDPPPAFYAAWAFAKTGKNALAAEVLERVILQGNRCDDVFRELDQVNPKGLVAFYEGLHRYATDDPRGLTWEGVHFFEAGQLREAEAKLREAIRIDPNDATGSHRFLAYHVLAEILERTHRKRDAQLCEARVAAAQIQARGDLLEKLGLNQWAASAYERALRTYPNDSDCEASLAECLVSLGLPTEAREHARRAFELMPSQVGPYEYDTPYISGYLGSKDVTEEGRRILAAIVKSRHSATAAFLLGHLDWSGNRCEQAIRGLRQAIALDPGLCVAWQDLKMAGRGILSPPELEQINYRILALHPAYAGLYGCEFDQIRDLRPAYRKVEEMIRTWPKLPDGPLYPLHPAPDFQAPAMRQFWFGHLGILGSPAGAFLLDSEPLLEILRAYSDHSEDY